MNICKSIIIAVPETRLKYEVRIDLIKSKKLSDGRIGWSHLGTPHIAKDGTKIGEGRYIVSIQGVQHAQLDHAGSTSLVTQSRIAANALYQAWVNWAQEEQRLQDVGVPCKNVRILPMHSHYWNL